MLTDICKYWLETESYNARAGLSLTSVCFNKGILLSSIQLANKVLITGFKESFISPIEKSFKIYLFS